MNRLMSVMFAAFLGLPGIALGQDDAQAERIRQLESQVQQLQRTVGDFQDQVGRLQSRLGESWMNERRAQEVRQLVGEVLADAQTRAAMLDNALLAGHDGAFFLASADGAFRLNLTGHLQVRYTFNQRDNSGDDDQQGGFNLRRAKFKANGWVTVSDQRIKYAFALASDQDRGDPPVFEDYYIELPDFPLPGLSVRAGRSKMPFAVQNQTHSGRQLAVERSAVHEAFRVDRSEGVMLRYADERWRFAVALSDGMQAQKTDFNQDSSDFAVTSRAEVLLAGEWKQLKDPAIAWSGEPLGLFLGGGIHYEVAETGQATLAGRDLALGTDDDVIFGNDRMLNWTADLTFEHSGLGLLIAGYGHHAFNELTADFNDFGLLIESGYFVIPDVLQPYVRYELILADDGRMPVASGSMEQRTNIFTVGLNWYQHRHKAKFTLDVIYALDPLTGSAAGPGSDPDSLASSSLGLRPDAAGQDGQIVIRGQYQLMW